MKHFFVLIIALSIMTMPALAFHPTTTSCDRCHVVHNAKSLEGMPLWSGLGIDPATAFTEYSSLTLDAQLGDPEGATLVCLGCHDNSTSASHYPEINPGGTAGDLSGTHPIGFVFDSALATADGELHDPISDSANIVGVVGTIEDELLSPKGKVNCVSCHEIHVNGLHGMTATEGEAAGLPYNAEGWEIPHLVNVEGVQFKANYGTDNTDPANYSLRYSAICITCHIK